MSSVSDVILLADKFGIRAMSSVSDVILLADRSGIRAVPSVPDVILDADMLGIRAVASVPDVILVADRSGIRATSRMPEVTLPAVIFSRFTSIVRSVSPLIKPESVRLILCFFVSLIDLKSREKSYDVVLSVRNLLFWLSGVPIINLWLQKVCPSRSVP